ncbi:YlxR family protein [Cutibacterium sp. WCA-380-WT-3A]|uniref:YlxR family protein n=1 Tax=Cutibacterium porci TaxID=2605781 RepID=A0A7K0J954_9ACTN|nr:YlxR family protein [Cutibacterium porci]MSS46491.1 YlxR family protein [Cutibacterium porci]
MTAGPQRTCVGCRRVDDSANMRRYVLIDGVVVADLTGHAQGRGAYVHRVDECWKRAVANGFARSFRARAVVGADCQEQLPGR